MRVCLPFLAFIWLFAVPAHAIGVDAPLPDRAQEERAQHVFSLLRCVVCSGQTLAESDVALARDMRRQVRIMVKTGASQEAILTYFTDRYGQDVLTAPPMQGWGAGLWGIPVLLLAMGGLFLGFFLKGMRA